LRASCGTQKHTSKPLKHSRFALSNLHTIQRCIIHLGLGSAGGRICDFLASMPIQSNDEFSECALTRFFDEKLFSALRGVEQAMFSVPEN
jgi:hypothetical protein